MSLSVCLLLSLFLSLLLVFSNSIPMTLFSLLSHAFTHSLSRSFIHTLSISLALSLCFSHSLSPSKTLSRKTYSTHTRLLQFCRLPTCILYYIFQLNSSRQSSFSQCIITFILDSHWTKTREKDNEFWFSFLYFDFFVITKRLILIKIYLITKLMTVSFSQSHSHFHSQSKYWVF